MKFSRYILVLVCCVLLAYGLGKQTQRQSSHSAAFQSAPPSAYSLSPKNQMPRDVGEQIEDAVISPGSESVDVAVVAGDSQHRSFERVLEKRILLLKKRVPAAIAERNINRVLDDPKEHWLVKREALRQIAARSLTLSESRKQELFQNLDRRTISSAFLSDEKLLELLGKIP